MSLTLPYSRSRRYLTGIDWFISALAHQSTRRNNRVACYSQTVLDVDGALSETAIRGTLDQISDRFRVIHGRIARDWLNLAPFWKMTPPPKDAVIPLRVVDLPEEREDHAEVLFSEHAAVPFDSPSRHLRFLLVRIGQRRSRLGMVFDHSLLDAFGAEMFFWLIDEAFKGHLGEISRRVRQTESAHLDHWMRRFRSGRTINRLLIRLGKQDTIALTIPRAGTIRRLRVLQESLSREESIRLRQWAGEEIGVPLLLPSAAARAILAMRRVFSGTFLPGSQFLVFTSANLRAPGQQWESLFFNHFSLLPLTLAVEPTTGVKEMAIVLRNQFFERMKDKIPWAMQDATMLGRIVPLWIASRLLRLVAKGRGCSFYFACIRDTGFSPESFMGLPTRQLVHQPLVFTPPGLNICMTEFRGTFNLVISYLEGVVDDSSAAQLMAAFKSLLLEPQCEPASR